MKRASANVKFSILNFKWLWLRAFLSLVLNKIEVSSPQFKIQHLKLKIIFPLLGLPA